jgi:dipeptidase D
MPTFVSDLDPKPLWKHFDAILAIPRPSGQEEAARQYVLGLAETKGLPVRRDSYGNFVVSKPASPGQEGAPTVVLQAHLDMVTEKNSDVQHDFTKDPIVPRREGEWVKATGTTLGADNGIGAAAMLAVLEADDLVHGPLEFLFTVEEETGLIGAGELDGSIVSGRLLLNLDTEEEGEVTIGCAGAGNTSLSLPAETAAPPSGVAALEVSVTGLKGGHSGMEIHLPRGNALKLLARALYAVSLDHPLHVATFTGGGKHNAIPREASAVHLVRPEDTGAIRAALDKEGQAIRAEMQPGEPDVRLDVREAPLPDRAWTETAGRRAVALVHALPHGVLTMSQDIPGLVETSTNLAAAARNGGFQILLSTRSMVDSALRGARQRIRAAAELAGASVEENKGYPGWKPDPHAALLATFQRLHESITGAEPELKAVHAGLECGVIGDKCPGMQMISFGPRIQGAHSPDERVHVESTERFWKLLVALLAELAK